MMRRVRPGLVLRDEILGRTGDAVVVSPAIDHRQLAAEIAVAGLCFQRLPLERGGAPRVAAGGLAVPDGPDQVEDEDQLCGADDQRHYRDEDVEIVRRRRLERDVA